MDEWMDGWMDGWINEWVINESMTDFMCTHSHWGHGGWVTVVRRMYMVFSLLCIVTHSLHILTLVFSILHTPLASPSSARAHTHTHTHTTHTHTGC